MKSDQVGTDKKNIGVCVPEIPFWFTMLALLYVDSRWFFFLSLLAIILSSSTSAAPVQPRPVPALKTYQGRVAWVNDGDTLVVRAANQRKMRVRLAGIDAPEAGQPFGVQAREVLLDIVGHRQVRLECQRKPDPYQRKLCKVFVKPRSCPQCGKTLDAGLAMLTVGMAWWYEPGAQAQSPEDQGAYSFAEHEARARKVGLWRDVQPVAPWHWRRQHPVPR